MLPGISMYYFTFDCLSGTECCLESVCNIIILLLPGISMFDGTECCLESVCIILLLSV